MHVHLFPPHSTCTTCVTPAPFRPLLPQVSLKSKPFTEGSVLVEVETSCKDGKPLKSKKADAGYDVYFCNDDPFDANKATEPLAKFFLGSVSLPKITLQFTKDNWDKPQLLIMYV